MNISHQLKPAFLEHANITVRDPDHCAQLLCDLFGWQIRWTGDSKDNGYTVHVGSKQNGDSYLALYTHPKAQETQRNHQQLNNLNHLGILVDDLENTEKSIIDHGFKPFSHGDYHPGRRFYFYLEPGLEIEVVSYNPKQ